MRPETLLAKAGSAPDPETGALIPPLHLATTYERDEAGLHSRGFRYSRLENPTRERFEGALATLEDGATCMAFSSGMASVTALLQTLQAGDHILYPDDVYHGVRKVIQDVFGRWGLASDAVDMSDPDAVRAALLPSTRMIWTETPSNPLLKITNLQILSSIAREADALLVVDGTWTTPLIQKPLEWGADVVMHSVTKYLAGHSDVLGGALVLPANSRLTAPLRSLQQEAGAVLDPFSSWLAMRGLRTLSVRLQHQCGSAMELALFLDAHPHVEKVNYPGLQSHPGHDIARKQMSAYGGMLSFQIRGGSEAAKDVARKTTLFANATSLGGTESLMEHRRSIEDAQSRTPENLLRVSIGLEHVEDLKEDLDRTLARVCG